jgi:LysM repeat protein
MKRRILVAMGGLVVVAAIGGLLFDWNADRAGAPVAPPVAVIASAAARQAVVMLPHPSAEKPKTVMPPSFDVVRVSPQGLAVIAGRAAPNAEITILDAGTVIGQATANGRGEWVFIPDKTLSPGSHSLSVTARKGGDDAGSDVLALVLPAPRQVPAAPPGSPPSAEPESIVVVRAGNSLWRIARHSYGGGEQYALIYKANRDRIGNPDLIYPGQVLTLPVSQ